MSDKRSESMLNGDGRIDDAPEPRMIHNSTQQIIENPAFFLFRTCQIVLEKFDQGDASFVNPEGDERHCFYCEHGLESEDGLDLDDHHMGCIVIVSKFFIEDTRVDFTELLEEDDDE